jgi:DUF3006 family protein
MEDIKASLDRVEGNYAVAYSDGDRRKFDIPLEMLPTGGKPGNRLILQLDGDVVANVTVDEKATADAKERIRRKYDKLRRGKHLKESG